MVHHGREPIDLYCREPDGRFDVGFRQSSCPLRTSGFEFKSNQAEDIQSASLVFVLRCFLALEQGSARTPIRSKGFGQGVSEFLSEGPFYEPIVPVGVFASITRQVEPLGKVDKRADFKRPA